MHMTSIVATSKRRVSFCWGFKIRGFSLVNVPIAYNVYTDPAWWPLCETTEEELKCLLDLNNNTNTQGSGILYQLTNRHLLKSQTFFKLYDWFLVIK